MKIILAALFCLACASHPAAAQEQFEKDVIPTAGGDLEVIFIGHGSLMLTYNGRIIHVDPYGRLADYAALPKADIILITHHHRDHLDPAALEQVRTDKTTVVLTRICARDLGFGTVMDNGDTRTVGPIKIEAVPAYNLVHKRDSGQFFHPKGEGNGYILTVADVRLYIAGDTENTPEMKELKNIDYAFLPMNLPYTMTPEMVADAVTAFKPKVLYPYHYGDTDTSRLAELLSNQQDTEVRIRNMR